MTIFNIACVLWETACLAERFARPREHILLCSSTISKISQLDSSQALDNSILSLKTALYLSACYQWLTSSTRTSWHAGLKDSTLVQTNYLQQGIWKHRECLHTQSTPFMACSCPSSITFTNRKLNLCTLIQTSLCRSYLQQKRFKWACYVASSLAIDRREISVKV